MRGDHLAGLLEMLAAVVALEQNRVHFFAQCGDVRLQLDLPLCAQLLGVLIDPRPARVDVRAAALIGGHHPRARHMVRPRRIVKHPGEDDDVRGIGSDDA